MSNLDIFLSSKGYLTSDDLFSRDEICIDQDKLLESIRYGDKSKFSVECIDEPRPSSDPMDLDCDDAIYKIADCETEIALSPDSGSSAGSLSSEQLEESNLKVVQVVGILQPDLNFHLVNNESESHIEDIEQSPHPTRSPDDQSMAFQELKLSDEEKRLLSKDGIKLPSHYPLTKHQERELKRIRRKIRNKISAQDSRKRKKEFLDTLQQKLQEVEEEKNQLGKRVRSLESVNGKLSAQVKRLQMALTHANNKANANSGANTVNSTVVPAATTLFVLILSLALVVIPTMQSKKTSNSIEHSILSTFQDSNPNGSVLGKSRTMMSLSNKLNHHGSSLNSAEGWNGSDEDIREPSIKIPRFSFLAGSSATNEKVGLSGSTMRLRMNPTDGPSGSLLGMKRPAGSLIRSSFHAIDEVDA